MQTPLIRWSLNIFATWNKNKVDIWLINGIPGAGKTTTAISLASRFSRGIHIEGDRLQELIGSGSIPLGSQPQMEEEHQIHLNVRNQVLLACSFAKEILHQ